ncbi:MAG TPA: DUF4290 domain-containing protein [Sphingobacteriaceae bacterium]|nr:DUF4290 domain-containing protein [Sphingobacteriaceae bacterium]
MEFDYNSTRPKLILAEYGRNVQNMVEYICDLPTKEERNRYAQVVIEMMGFLNPHLRDVADFKHKLWDHLHIISDFKIDVDSPYPIPDRDTLHPKPEQLAYPHQRIRFKHYGHTVEIMIDRAKKIVDEKKRTEMTEAIANFMKMAYVTWNKDSVTDDAILKDLNDLSGGELKISPDFVLTKLDFKTPPPGNRTKGGSSSGQQSSGGKGKKQKKRSQHSNGGKRYAQ